jgi:hypothetical protein
MRTRCAAFEEPLEQLIGSRVKEALLFNQAKYAGNLHLVAVTPLSGRNAVLLYFYGRIEMTTKITKMNVSI